MGKPDGRFRAELGDQVKPFVLHDLRRVFASGMQRLGVRLEVTESLLGHVSGTRAGIVGVYQVYRYEDEKRVGNPPVGGLPCQPFEPDVTRPPKVTFQSLATPL